MVSQKMKSLKKGTLSRGTTGALCSNVSKRVIRENVVDAVMPIFRKFSEIQKYENSAENFQRLKNMDILLKKFPKIHFF